MNDGCVRNNSVRIEGARETGFIEAFPDGAGRKNENGD
jgi:hypothetical protein